MLNPIEELDHFLYWGAGNTLAFAAIMVVVAPCFVYVAFQAVLKLDDLAENWHPHLHKWFGKHHVSNMDKGEPIRKAVKASK